MKRRNKFIALLLIALLCCLFVGCDKEKQEEEPQQGSVVKTALTPVCNGRYNKTVNNTDITADFCSCNCLGVVLDKSGATTDISRHTLAEIPQKVLEDFDDLSDLYAAFMDGYELSNSFQNVALTTESEKYGAYTAFTSKAQSIFSACEFDATKEVTYDVSKSAIVGINKSFAVSLDDMYDYSDKLFVVSELFGYKSKETFIDYAKKLVAAFGGEKTKTVEELRLSLDGAIYTENGSYIMPYVVTSKLSDNFVVCLILTQDGALTAWVSNVKSAADAVDLRDVKGSATFFMYGRCSLFDTSSGYYQFSLEGDTLPKGKYAKMKLSTSDGLSKTITIMLLPEYAPKSVANFIAYAEREFLDGTYIHRIVSDGCLQGGGYVYKNGYRAKNIPEDMKEIEGEFSSNGHPENVIGHCPGTVSMARTSALNSGTSQFFLCFNYYQSWDGQYAGFGFMPYPEDIEFVKNLGTTTSINGNDQPTNRRIVIEEVKIFEVGKDD